MELSGTYDEEANSFALIAGVLTQEVFITLNRFMQKSYDTKEWEDLKAGMRCFTQIVSRFFPPSDAANCISFSLFKKCQTPPSKTTSK